MDTQQDGYGCRQGQRSFGRGFGHRQRPWTERGGGSGSHKAQSRALPAPAPSAPARRLLAPAAEDLNAPKPSDGSLPGPKQHTGRGSRYFRCQSVDYLPGQDIPETFSAVTRTPLFIKLIGFSSVRQDGHDATSRPASCSDETRRLQTTSATTDRF